MFRYHYNYSELCWCSKIVHVCPVVLHLNYLLRVNFGSDDYYKYVQVYHCARINQHICWLVIPRWLTFQFCCAKKFVRISCTHLASPSIKSSLFRFAHTRKRHLQTEVGKFLHVQVQFISLRDSEPSLHIPDNPGHVFNRYNWNYCLVYLYYILTISKDADTHLLDVYKVFYTLRRSGLSLKTKNYNGSPRLSSTSSTSLNPGCSTSSVHTLAP